MYFRYSYEAIDYCFPKQPCPKEQGRREEHRVGSAQEFKRSASKTAFVLVSSMDTEVVDPAFQLACALAQALRDFAIVSG